MRIRSLSALAAAAAAALLSGCLATTPTVGGGDKGTVTGAAGGGNAENNNSALEKCSETLGTLAMQEDVNAPWYVSLRDHQLEIGRAHV